MPELLVRIGQVRFRLCQEACEFRSPDGCVEVRKRAVKKVAKQSGRTPAQVLLRWCVQRGVPALAKSTRRERIEENMRIFDFALSDEQISDLDACDQTGGTDRASESE